MLPEKLSDAERRQGPTKLDDVPWAGKLFLILLAVVLLVLLAAKLG